MRKVNKLWPEEKNLFKMLSYPKNIMTSALFSLITWGWFVLSFSVGETSYGDSAFPDAEVGSLQALLSPVLSLRAWIISDDALLRLLARPSQHIRSMKQVVGLKRRPNSLVE